MVEIRSCGGRKQRRELANGGGIRDWLRWLEVDGKNARGRGVRAGGIRMPCEAKKLRSFSFYRRKRELEKGLARALSEMAPSAEAWHCSCGRIRWDLCRISINTCNGFYCDSITPNNSTSPKLWTENWTGWFKAWDKPDPHRFAEDLGYSVARFFQSSGTLQNYYMYRGGTNFGRTTGGPYITTTYDYDAPIDECGNIRQPKWGNLKNLHAVIKKMEKALTYGNAKATRLVNRLSVTKFFDIAVVPGCFLANKNKTDDATLDFEGTKYFLPAWSVSILPDCKQEVYNTAKVNAQTSIMMKKPNQAEAEPTSLIWSWKPEDLSKPVQGLEPDFTTNTLRDQILASVDASDYLWYITSVNVSQDEQMSLQMNTAGHILHAFVNGDLIGSEYAPNGKFSFVFEKEVVLNQEMNIIALLSATVGFKNYGSYYELMPAGIVGGSVKSIGNYNDTIDLSFSKWSYKVGLNGKKQQVYLDNSNSSWNTGDMFPKKVPFTWYKACVGQATCSVPMDEKTFGASQCNYSSSRRLAVQATCA